MDEKMGMQHQVVPSVPGRSFSRVVLYILVMASVLAGRAKAEDAVKILFIGSSFTFGAGTVVQTYHPETVTDLNGQHTGGIPSLFKAFAVQTHLNYQVNLETMGGKSLDYHVQEKAAGAGTRAEDWACRNPMPLASAIATRRS
jgi:hypothetical protein